MLSTDALADKFLRLRGDFPVFRENPGLVYLDSAATTQKPESVIGSIVDFYEKSNSNVHRGVYPLAERATSLYENSRRAVSVFLDSSYEEVIFTKSTTEGLNMLASSLAGTGVYKTFAVPVFEHHSNFVPWQQHAKRNGLDFIPLPVSGVKLSIESVRRVLSQIRAPFVFAVTGLVNSTGYRTDFEEIAELVHNHGGVIALDGAQLIPHERFSFRNSEIDFLAFSGHKLLAETGVGCLLMKKKFQEEIPPFLFGGEMVNWVEESDTSFAEGVSKFEGGTPNISGAISLKAAVEYLETVDMDLLEAHVANLTDLARQKLSAIPGLTIHSPENSHAIVMFTHEKIHSHDLSEFLGRRLNIAVRSGHHCSQLQLKSLGLTSSCRASFYLYNTFEDVGRLAEGIEEAVRWFL